MSVSFLSAIWPAQGPFVIATPAQWRDKQTGDLRTGFNHIVVASPDEAMQRAVALATWREEPKDVYFALGTFNDPTIRGRGLRKQPNIKQLRAFWLDIDVGPNKDHATKQGAVEALVKFCRAFGFPTPTVVDSGGGLHVYWPLTEALDTGDWLDSATKLKALAKLGQVGAGPERTADCASVLRVPGTFNYKDPSNPRPVVVRNLGTPTGANAMRQHIETQFERYKDSMPKISAPAAAPTLALTGQRPDLGQPVKANPKDALGGILSAEPAVTKRVLEGCRQLQWQAANQHLVSEPQWYDMIGLLRFTDAAPTVIHRMGCRHPGYNQAATDQKIAQHQSTGYGPTRCQTFEDHNPGGCRGCPHANKITSPIVLGMSKRDVGAPQVTDQATGIALKMPAPQAPYKRILDDKTGEIVVAMEIENSDERVIDVTIYEHDLYPTGLIYDERTKAFNASIRRYLPQDGWDEFLLPLGQFYDQRRLAVALGNMGIMPDAAYISDVVNYMVGYVRNLQRQMAASVEYAQLGWRQDGSFVLADRTITAQGVRPVRPSKNITAALKWVAPQGALQDWVDIVSTWNKPGMEPHQFGLMVGFAAPLLSMTQYAGLIVSMVGEPGSGKSSAALIANSIWGHPTMGWADIGRDSEKSFYNKAGVLNNLPLTYDEITNLDPKQLSDLCYSVSKGTGRQTLNQDGTAKESENNWRTIMLSTSNAFLHDKLSLAKANSSAEAVRVFEYSVPAGTLDKAVADVALSRLADTYGLAGPVFAEQLVANRDAIKARVQHWIQAVDRRAAVSSRERFWSAGVACVLAALEVTNALGLTAFSIPRLLEFAVGAINMMRTGIQDTVKTPLGILNDYLNQNVGHMLIVQEEGRDGRPPLISQMPRNELRIRVEMWNGHMYIDRSHFHRFCTDNYADLKQIRADLTKSGVLKNPDYRTTLGRGTSIQTGQSRAWILDLSHPQMAGALAQERETASTDAVTDAITRARNASVN